LKTGKRRFTTIKRALDAVFLAVILSSFTATLATCAGGDTDENTDDDIDDDDVGDDDSDDDSDDDDDLPRECPDIYDQDVIPVFEVEISQDVWDQIVYEYQHWRELEEQGLPIKNYYPLLSFRYEDEVIDDAMIRLKGSPESSWDNTKMQFKISFNEFDPGHRFHGLRKLNLDAPINDPTMLRERLGMALFQDIGVPAACVNHARLVINGEYYGLFVNIENVDKEFIQRNFGNDDEGNLYKYTRLETNEEIGDTSDMDQFMNDPDISTLEEIVDLEEAILEWACEAVIPQMDGFFVGGINYYMYNHPKRGFIFIPHDMDYCFEVGDFNADLITYEVGWGLGKPQQFLTVIADPEWYLKYLDAVDTALLAYDVETLHSRLDLWAQQIADSIDEDPNKNFTTEEHIDQVQTLRTFIEDRAYFVALWLNCKRGEGEYEIVDWGDQRFCFWHTQCSWENALDFCESMGGSLAVPTDGAEQNFLVSEAFGLLADDWWTGANDIEDEGVWTDPNGVELTYLPWAPDQPNGNETQNCVVIDQNLGGFWNDKHCQEVYPSICRIY